MLITRSARISGARSAKAPAIASSTRCAGIWSRRAAEASALDGARPAGRRYRQGSQRAGAGATAETIKVDTAEAVSEANRRGENQ